MRILLFAAALLAPSQTSLGFDIHLFPAPTTYDSDLAVFHERLGIDRGDVIIEDFEDRGLIPGLSVSGPVMSRNSESAWDGEHAVGPFSEVEFKVRHDNVRLFGVGVGDNDEGGEWVSINGQQEVRLGHLPYFLNHSGGRAYYVLIQADRDDPPIRSVRFGNGFTIECDHVILVPPDRTDDDRFVFSLTDGSEIVDRIPGGVISVSLPTTGSILNIPDRRIRSIENAEEGPGLTVSLENGDVVSGITKNSNWNVISILGQLKIERNLVRSIESLGAFKDLIDPLALAKRKIPKGTVFPPFGFLRGGPGMQGVFPAVARAKPQEFDRIWRLGSGDEEEKTELIQILSDRSTSDAHRRLALCSLGEMALTDENILIR